MGETVLIGVLAVVEAEVEAEETLRNRDEGVTAEVRLGLLLAFEEDEFWLRAAR